MNSKKEMSEIPMTTPYIKKLINAKQEIYKKATLNRNKDDYDFGPDGKIKAIEDSCDCPIMKKVCYMLATSHEYKKPNTENTIAFVKNYKWEETTANPNDLQGIDKPVIKEKVDSLAEKMKKPSPLIVVDKLNGIKPQSRGKLILMDGHHRKEAYKVKEWDSTPVYKGTYTGEDSVFKNDLAIPHFPKNRKLYFAFDFDGTIHDGDYHGMGAVKEDTVALMKRLRKLGHIVIIYTCRNAKACIPMKEYLKENKIPYDYINENPLFDTGSTKIYADVYFDDRAFNASDVSSFNSVDIPEYKGE